MALIIAAALMFGLAALGVLLWTLDSGQYDDLQGDAERILIEDPDGARAIVAEYGERIVAGIDARGDRVATRGWQKDAGVLRDDLVRDVAAWGVRRIVYTEIARDGMGSGYDVAALAHVAALAPVRITASGGAKSLADLTALRAGTPPNVDAAIVGRALYEGTLDLAQALNALS